MSFEVGEGAWYGAERPRTVDRVEENLLRDEASRMDDNRVVSLTHDVEVSVVASAGSGIRARAQR